VNARSPSGGVDRPRGLAQPVASTAEASGADMTWETIKYVTSGLSLVAFLATVAATLYMRRLSRDEQMIRSAPEDKRADLVLATLAFFRIDASKLTKQQQYDLAIRQISDRSRRFSLTALLIGFVTIVGACLAGYAIARGGEARKMKDSEKELTSILDHRAELVMKSIESQKAVVSSTGRPAQASGCSFFPSS
jgi:hypothetical protein